MCAESYSRSKVLKFKGIATALPKRFFTIYVFKARSGVIKA